MAIKFSPPDISEEEINEVVDTLKSGWLTTGSKAKLFEQKIADFCKTNRAACLNSATSGMELVLRLFGIGQGDEVITSAYTYTASASVINHVGAKIVLVDTAPDSYEMDYQALKNAINENTKAIIPVDIAGIMCDYELILKIVNAKKHLFKPSCKMQQSIGRVLVLADAAHSFGSIRDGIYSGNYADFSVFSFHAVKNLTTGEGGGITWRTVEGVSDEEIYNKFMLFSLHGQTKDALLKLQSNEWEYDIKAPYYKCNMTDIQASIGIAQLKRYESLLKRRQEIVEIYENLFEHKNVSVSQHTGNNYVSCKHLFIVRLNGKDEHFRNNMIAKLAQRKIPTNVHYKPLPMMTAYKNLGFNINNFNNAYRQYANSISLPLHTLLTDNQAEFIADAFVKALEE